MNNLNDDYLWDRTGEPDPEIQQLEEVLGTLRYQPRPLEIPADVQPGRQRFNWTSFSSNHTSALAIAATLAAIVLGLGLWVGLQKKTAPESARFESAVDKSASSVQAGETAEVGANKADVGANDTGDKAAHSSTIALIQPIRHRPNPTRTSQVLTAANRNRNRIQAMKNSELAESELREAEAGKQQLMLALRVASSKLNFAQKKTQGTNFENQIHNQHKIG